MSGLSLYSGESVILEIRPSRLLYTIRWLPISAFGAGLTLLWLGYYYLVNLPQISRSVGELGLMALKILGAPLLLFGGLLFLAPLVYNFLESGNVRYVITDRRILIRKGAFRSREVELFLDRVGAVEVKRSFLFGGRAGSVRMLVMRRDAESPFYMRKFPSEKFRGPVIYALDAVGNVDEVKDVIERAIMHIKNGNPEEEFLHQSL